MRPKYPAFVRDGLVVYFVDYMGNARPVLRLALDSSNTEKVNLDIALMILNGQSVARLIRTMTAQAGIVFPVREPPADESET